MVTKKINDALCAHRHGWVTTISQMRKLFLISLLLGVSAMISACQTDQREITSFSVQSNEKIGVIMPKLVGLAAKCLAGTGKPFANYRVSSELNSLSGQPRLLLVRRNDPQGLPGLVILGQAKDGGTTLSIFGRLLSGNGPKAIVSRNVRSWANGGADCA
ncbi:MAG: hypothetical protein AAF141_01925 [Pseudomonadota bacterium]